MCSQYSLLRSARFLWSTIIPLNFFSCFLASCHILKATTGDGRRREELKRDDCKGQKNERGGDVCLGVGLSRRTRDFIYNFCRILIRCLCFSRRVQRQPESGEPLKKKGLEIVETGFGFGTTQQTASLPSSPIFVFSIDPSPHLHVIVHNCTCMIFAVKVHMSNFQCSWTREGISRKIRATYHNTGESSLLCL